MQKIFPLFRNGIGQSCRRFLPEDSSKPCILGGLIFEDTPGLQSESDGDVVFHAICNAITSLTGIPILNGIAKELCRKDGITDSQVYAVRALSALHPQRIVHVALSIEGKRPDIEERLEEMRRKVAEALEVAVSAIGITAISGEGLTDVGCGEGIQCLCLLTTIEN